MKGLILAGGAGTRLRPITHTRAKQLVPVANTPILFFGLEQMAEAGIRQVGIIVGDTADEVQERVGDGSRWGIEVTYIRQEAPLGLAHCVLIAREFLGDDDFVMYLGDNLLRQGLLGFVERFVHHRLGERTPRLGEDGTSCVAQILLARVPDPQRFGVAVMDDRGEVVGLVEKPAVPPSDLALVGVYLFDRHIHEAVRAIRPSARGELEITDAIQWLIDEGQRVRHEVVDGWWIDTGTVEALLDGNRLVLEAIEPSCAGDVDARSSVTGRVIVGEGAEIKGSVIRGPVVIGAGVRVIDSFIGPFTAIDERCEIVDTEIEHSIVLAGSRVAGVPRIEDSLIGYDADISRSERRPRASRLVVGDHSRVDLG